MISVELQHVAVEPIRPSKLIVLIKLELSNLCDILTGGNFQEKPGKCLDKVPKLTRSTAK